jgi:hypothetical protein
VGDGLGVLFTGTGAGNGISDGRTVGIGRGVDKTRCVGSGRGVTSGLGVTIGRGAGECGTIGRDTGSGRPVYTGPSLGNRITGSGAICGGRGTTG